MLLKPPSFERGLFEGVKKSSVMKTVKKIFILIGFSVFALQSQANEQKPENSFCQKIEEIYLNEFVMSKAKAVQTLFPLLKKRIDDARDRREKSQLAQLKLDKIETYVLGMHPFFISSKEKQILLPIDHPHYLFGVMDFYWPSSIEKTGQWWKMDNIERFEKMLEEEKDDSFLRIIALNFLTLLYFDKGDIEKSYHYLYERAVSSLHETSTAYEMALFYSKICKEELKETHAKVMLEKLADFNELKKAFPDIINVGAYIKFYMNINNYPTDYIQAYYWADLAVKRNLPLALELRNLIAEKI